MAARGTIRMAIAFAALLAALTSVVWRQSRALDVLRTLDAVRQDRALAEAERAQLTHDAQRLESRRRIADVAARRLGLRVPAASEIVILRASTASAAPVIPAAGVR
jgi:cell division protein FtsL